jgi:transposase
MPGVGRGFTALSLAGRVGRVARFPRAHSLANYWGLTPGCRNSGENDQRLGRITKAGSATARWLLAQLVHKVLRRDARLRDWFKRVKRRRGPTVARVAVIRRRYADSCRNMVTRLDRAFARVLRRDEDLVKKLRQELARGLRHAGMDQPSG